LRAAEVFGVAEYLNTCAEAVYKSTVEEPLGKVMLRGHQLPGVTQEPAFTGFGKATPCAAFGAKESIFPRDVEPEGKDVKAMYQRTHGDFDPGEMFHRGYSWPNEVRENPHFQFGRAAAGANNGVKAALSAHLLDATGNFPVTNIVNHASECYQQVTADPLAKSKNRLQGPPKVPGSHAFGRASGHDPVPAGKIINGCYSAEDCLPDKDLGRCIAPGRRNFVTDSSLGAPTIRSDKVAPPFERRSVASTTNYGDDHSAYSLLFPDKWGAFGLSRDDFQLRRGRQELLGLLEAAGHPMDNVVFEGIFCAACNMYGDNDRRASLETLMTVCANPDFGAPPHAQT